MRDDIKVIKGNIKNHLDDSNWLHYHHKDDPRQKTDGFGDSPHHTGFAFSPLFEMGYVDEDLKKRLYEGYRARMTENGLIRHIRTIEAWNRDQFVSAIHMLKYVVGATKARFLYQIYRNKLKMGPGHKAYCERVLEIRDSWRWVGDIAEVIDTCFDIFNDKIILTVIPWLKKKLKPKSKSLLDKILDAFSGRNGIDSSIIKNFMRSHYNNELDHSWRTAFNWWFLNKAFDRTEVFTRYFTFKHGGDDRPAKIHLVWHWLWEIYPTLKLNGMTNGSN